MEKLYYDLRNKFKKDLNNFRNRLLLSDLMKGSTIILSFLILYLFLFFLVNRFFVVTITFKTIAYYLFLSLFVLLFIICFFYPFVKFFRSFYLVRDFLLKRILKVLPGSRDIFISLYTLCVHPNKVVGDNQLKKAAFVQKYEHVRENGKGFRFPNKTLLKPLVFFLSFLFVVCLNYGFIGKVYSDLQDYTEVTHQKKGISFQILNETLDVEYGKPFQLKLKVDADFQDIENVFVCYGGGEFLMDKKDSIFEYDFDIINNDLKFNFKTQIAESKEFMIRVLLTPEITDYHVTGFPPAYTGLKPETYKNTMDFQVLYGTSLKFNLEFSNLDTLFLKQNDKYSPIDLKPDFSASFSKVVKNSGEFSLVASNKNFIRKDLLHFTLTCIPDLYPGIQVNSIQDSLRSSVYYFYGVITDDYGFTDLRFNYSLNGRSNTVIPVQIAKNINTQEFYFTFDFAEFAGMDKADIRYFFEVFDNDNLSGPKSTRSDVKNYLVPDLDAIFDYNVETNTNVNASLNEAEKLAKEIVSNVKELQKKLLDNNVDNWEKQQLSKDIVEKKKKLDQLLNTVKEENLKKTVLNKSFTKQDSLLLEKQNKIQDLLDNIMDDDMKKLMKEFSELSEKFSKDKFQNLDEQMKLSFDQMSEELDRNIELLKRYQIEERHDLVTKQIEKLKKDQQDFQNMINDKSISKDSLAAFNEQMKENVQKIQKNYEELLNDNKNLSTPYELKNLNPEFDKLSQNIDKQKQESSEGKKNSKLSEQIEKQIEDLSEEMEEQKQKNFNNMSIPENDIELIIQNILIISLSQEELLQDFRNVQSQSVRYNELGRLQDLKRQEYKIVKDSLSVLAKSNLMLASLLSDKFYDIEIKFGLLPKYIQDNKRGELLKEQQYIINYLNDIALSLTEALQKSKQNSKESKDGKDGKPGSKKGGKSSGNKQNGYGQMKQMQNGIKKQLESMISQMKQGLKGKPLQQGISKMIRENEMFQKSLNDFISESGSLSPGEKQLLNEINRLLEENIRDMANFSVSGQLINRNNQIYNKLLMSEKASKEREEYEEKRKSETAKETLYKRPETVFDAKSKPGFVRTDLNKSGVQLNGYFKNMYNNYYIKLGNE